MKRTLALVVAALLVASSTSAPYQKCTEGAAPAGLRVEGCNATPCQIARGSTVKAELDFVATSNTKTLTPRVRATAFGMTVSYPLPEKDGCVSLKNSKCPLKVGQKATHNFVMPVNKLFPRIPVTVEFSFLDDAKKTIVCYKLPIRIR